MLSLLFILDANAWSHYVKVLKSTSRQYTKPTFAEKNYVMDAVSPRILPVREYFSNQPLGDLRPGRELSAEKFQGMYYQFVDLDRYLTPSDEYFARYNSYKALSENPVYEKYLSIQNKLFVKTEYAIIGSENVLSELIKDDLLDKIIVLNPDVTQKHDLIENHGSIILNSLSEYANKQTTLRENNIEENLQINLSSSLLLNSGNSNFDIFAVKISEIPAYLSTIIATEDRNRFKVSIGDNELYAVQGEIIEPFSFDIHNMIPDSLVFSLPKGFEKDKHYLDLSYSKNFQAGIVDVFHNTNDHLGLVVNSKSNGWLLYHSPFTEQFKVMINNMNVSTFKANGAFIAVPLKKGINRVEYLYMPESIIPTLILLSLMLSLLFFVALIVKELVIDDKVVNTNLKNQIT